MSDETYTFSMPETFVGHERQRYANYESHHWVMDWNGEDRRCADCDCNGMVGESRWWPCGAKIPRITRTFPKDLQ
jgi:hypothetical protein